MINENLHKKPVALDRVKHRDLKLDQTVRDMATIKTLNAFFVAGTEFGDACRDYPVVWVNAGNDAEGRQQVAPIAVFGLTQGSNLCVENDAWRVRYVPAVLRLFPFALARTGPTEMVVCFDESWAGFATGNGQALFNPDGSPSAFTQEVQKQLEAFEVKVERTRRAGALLVEKGLLREMRFDATLPNGAKLTVDGFLAIDEEKLNALNDADVLALTRNGLLGLIHAHQISMGNMNRLVEWHAQRVGALAPAAA